MVLPPNSLISLQGHSRPGEGVTMPKIAMVVRMTEETLNALQSLSGADRMGFEFGDKSGIYVRDQFFPMRYDKEKDNQELFIRTTMPTRPNAPLRLNANVVGKFSVEQVLSDKLSQRLHNSTAAAVKQKNERKAILLDSQAVTPTVPQKPAPKKKAPPKSTPKPTIVKSYATTSPSQTVTGTASASVALPKELATMYRQRLIHYLALGSATVQGIFKEFGGSEIDHNTRTGIMDLLFEVAEQEQVPRKVAATPQATSWRLKPQTWLEVRPYQYSGYTDNVRTKVARTARTWFGSLKIPDDNPAWDHVKFRDSGHGGPSSNVRSEQRALNGTSSAAAKAKAKAKEAKEAKTKEAEMKVKSESAAPSTRPSQVQASLPPKLSALADRSTTPMQSTKGKEREADTDKEEGELSASQTPPRKSATPVERRAPGSRVNGASTPTMPPPPVPVSSQPSSSSQLSSSTSSKRTGPVDARGHRRPPPEPSERARAVPPIPPPAPTDRKPVVQVKKEVIQPKKERVSASKGENGITTSASSMQPTKERELARRERERERESDRESIRMSRKERERESDRESVRGRTGEKAAKEKDYGRERDQERSKDKIKERGEPPPSRAVVKASTKRKPSEGSEDESSDWGYEDRQSLRKLTGSKIKRERDSAPAKVTSTSLKVTQRESPPPKQKIKRETSPLPAAKTKSSVDRKVTAVSSSVPKAAKKEAKSEGLLRSTATKHKRRRSSIDFTSSSEEEEEEPKPKVAKSSAKAASSLASKNSTATASAALAGRSLPSKPRPTLSKREQLRLRYSAKYNEYIVVFQRLVAQKNKFASLLRHGSESPSADSDVDDMMPLDELEELTARHQRLHDELEEIKKGYMA